MMKENELDLLIDIVKLLKKYGPESFESLSEALSTEENIKKITMLLKNVSNISTTMKSSHKKSTQNKHKNVTVKGRGARKQKSESYEEDRSLGAWSGIILNGKTKE